MLHGCVFGSAGAIKKPQNLLNQVQCDQSQIEMKFLFYSFKEPLDMSQLDPLSKEESRL